MKLAKSPTAKAAKNGASKTAALRIVPNNLVIQMYVMPVSRQQAPRPA
jgi:hypothetical protein